MRKVHCLPDRGKCAHARVLPEKTRMLRNIHVKIPGNRTARDGTAQTDESAYNAEPERRTGRPVRAANIKESLYGEAI